MAETKRADVLAYLENANMIEISDRKSTVQTGVEKLALRRLNHNTISDF